VWPSVWEEGGREGRREEGRDGRETVLFCVIDRRRTVCVERRKKKQQQQLQQQQTFNEERPEGKRRLKKET